MGAARPALLSRPEFWPDPCFLDMQNPIRHTPNASHMKHYAASIAVCVYTCTHHARTLHAHLLLYLGTDSLRSAPPPVDPRSREHLIKDAVIML